MTEDDIIGTHVAVRNTPVYISDFRHYHVITAE